MKRLLTLGLLGLLSACQPAFATDRIPTAAEQYRRTLVRSAHAGMGPVGADRHLCRTGSPGKPLAC